MSSYRPHPWVNNLNRVWSTGTLDWVVMTQPGAAAGGGDASAANQLLGNASLASIDSKTPALGQALAAGAVPVVLTAIQVAALTPLSSVTTVRPTLGTRTTVGALNADTALLAANAARFGATVHNDADKTLYLALGTAAASATSFTAKVLAGGYYETPFNFSGAVRGFWDTAPTGNARITELT